MVSTRRGRVQGDQPVQQVDSPAPVAKPRRARKAAVTNGDAVDTPKPSARARRLRSDKDAASPLQKLEEPTRKRSVKAPKATAPDPPAQDDEVFEEEDTGLFFRESFQKNKADLRTQLHTLQEEKTQLKRKLNGEPTVPLSELTGEELLERIENRKREARRSSATSPRTDQDGTKMTTPQDNGAYDGCEEAFAAMDIVSETPATSSTILEAHHSAPRTTGWGFKSFLDRIIPAAFRPGTPPPALVAPPATAPPRPLNSDEIRQLNENLISVDTPTRKPVPKKTRPKTKRSKTASSKRIIPSQRAIITRVTKNVKPDQKSGAIEWAKKQAEALAAQGSLGDKRKRLEQPLKIKDIKSIPSSLPWQTGSYGLVDDFWDDSDEEGDAPEWYKLEQLANEPPLKRQRVEVEEEGDSIMTDTTTSSFANTPTSSFASISSSSLVDISHSPSRRPRPSTTPSPMFNNPTIHRSGQNIFEEHRTQSPPEANLTSGSFSFPDDLSDNENAEVSSGGSSPWTQAPPPPPAPAHASLPTPVTATPSVPTMSAETFFPPSDPVKDARKEAMKYTPAKPSRLRNVISQSPIPGSLSKKLSDAQALNNVGSAQSGDPTFYSGQKDDCRVDASMHLNSLVAEHIFKDDPEMMQRIQNHPKATGNEPWYAQMKANYAAVFETIQSFV